MYIFKDSKVFRGDHKQSADSNLLQKSQPKLRPRSSSRWKTSRVACTASNSVAVFLRLCYAQSHVFRKRVRKHIGLSHECYCHSITYGYKRDLLSAWTFTFSLFLSLWTSLQDLFPSILNSSVFLSDPKYWCFPYLFLQSVATWKNQLAWILKKNRAWH